MAKGIKKTLRKLDKRVSSIEEHLGTTTAPEAPDEATTIERCCSMPRVPEQPIASDVSEFRAGLLRYLRKKWVNGTTLRFFFMTGHWAGPESEIQMVRDAFKVWSDVGIGIEFMEVDAISEAEIRISFEQTGRTWSYVGRDVVDIPGQHEPTMNYGWRMADDPRGVDVAVHEIGHTLGFPHEHQNPFAGIVWDEEAVYRHFARQGWNRGDTDHNVLNKHDANAVEGSDWDPDSIMHYGFPPGLIQQPARYRRDGLQPARGLTATDREEVRRLYPPLEVDQRNRLIPFEMASLTLGAGEQAEFVIEPDATRSYQIQTFGLADTVMVLFEKRDGHYRFVAGDDDSGFRRNASITERLYPGREYLLRVRLYLNWASAQTRLMLW